MRNKEMNFAKILHQLYVLNLYIHKNNNEHEKDN